jgi:hypothetical protein
MFGQITIHRGLTANKFDLGLLAETLLFYSDVLLLLDRGSLSLLLSALDQDTILRLVDEFGLKLSYHRENFGTITTNKNGVAINNFSDFKASGPKRKIRSVHEEIEEVLGRQIGTDRQARRFKKKIIEKTSSFKFQREDCVSLIEAARSDIKDKSYTNDAVKNAISILAPSITPQSGWRYDTIDLGKEGFLINTNIDFSLLDKAYREVSGQEDGSLTEALVCSYIFDARVNSYLASSYMSGYVCDPLSSFLMKRKFLDLIRRRERDAAEVDLFQEKLLPEGRRIREVINSGEASFSDALSVIRKGEKFKGWLRKQNPDSSLLQEYVAEITKPDWVQKLPPKVYRFIISVGLGALAGAVFSPLTSELAGAGLSAIDMFLVDRLLKGWRPDQFVNGSLSNFVDGNNN